MAIEKDTEVMFDILSIHFDPSIYGDDVNEFRPERYKYREKIK